MGTVATPLDTYLFLLANSVSVNASLIGRESGAL